MALLGGDGEGAKAVQGQVGFGIDHAVHPVVCDVPGGKAVLAALGQGDEHLVGGDDLNGRAGVLTDGNAAEHQLYLVLLPGGNGELAVFDFSGEEEYVKERALEQLRSAEAAS